MTTAPTISESVFSDADSDWNIERSRLEAKALQATAELIAHGACAALEIQGYGVSVRASVLPKSN